MNQTQSLKKLLQADSGNFDAYSEIELTEDETKEALMLARAKKHGEIKRKAYSEKLWKERQDPIYTAENLKTLILNNQNIQIDEFNEAIIWQMCLYFTEDVRSELNKDKGLLLYGGIGCGKTTLMEHFKINQVSSFFVKSTRQVAYEYANHGTTSIIKYNSLLSANNSNPPYNHKLLGVCFDDLGTEVDKKHYGNESNVMAEILLNRYDRLYQFDSTGKKVPLIAGKTHITTNLNTTEIGERYGDRVRSRLREMFNVLVFDEKSPDRRK